MADAGCAIRVIALERIRARGDACKWATGGKSFGIATGKRNMPEQTSGQEGEMAPFDPSDYVSNLVALARMQAGVRQVELAAAWVCKKAYLSAKVLEAVGTGQQMTGQK